MQAFLYSLLGMFKEFITSKKVLTAILTGVATTLIKDPSLRTNVVEIGAVLLAGQGLADHGKAAAIVNAANPKPETQATATVNNVTAVPKS